MTEVELIGTTLPAEQSPLPRDRNPYDVYLDSLGSQDSRRTTAACLDNIARLIALEHGVELLEPPGRYLTWGELRYEHTMKIRSTLIQHRVIKNDRPQPLAPAYINKHLAALRKVLEHAWMLGLMHAEDYQRARSIKGVEGARLSHGRNIAVTEMAALLKVCVEDDSPAGIRDAALIALLQSTGGRRAEVAGALIDEYDPGSRTLRIIGKRNKEREVDLHEQAAVYLGRWIVKLGASTGPIFRPIDKWGNIKRDGMTPGAILRIVNKRRKQAGLPPMTPHDFRKTFIGALLDEGVDLSTAQKIAGHESPTTTARYDLRPRRTRKEAVEKLAQHLPSLESLRDAKPVPQEESET